MCGGGGAGGGWGGGGGVGGGLFNIQWVNWILNILVSFYYHDLHFMLYCKSDKPSRKRAYSNILKILQPIKENFQIKNSYIFHISSQNIDCGQSLEPHRRVGSNEYQQSMF